MSYTPTTWTTGDTITATALNKIENGIAEGGGGGWDAEIYIYHANGSGEYEVTAISGSYSALKEKLMNKQPPYILAHVWDEASGYKGTTTMTSIYAHPNQSYPTIDLIFAVKVPSTSTTTHTNWFAVMISWDVNDEVGVW